MINALLLVLVLGVTAIAFGVDPGVLILFLKQ
jgi:hypothetical protein